MKTHTNIEQSKKLAEILPLESADMARFTGKNRDVYPRDNVIMTNYILAKKEFSICGEIPIEPCWSLAALIHYLSSCQLISPNPGEKIYYCKCEGQETSADNSVDACYEMIIKLNEQKLL